MIREKNLEGCTATVLTVAQVDYGKGTGTVVSTVYYYFSTNH